MIKLTTNQMNFLSMVNTFVRIRENGRLTNSEIMMAMTIAKVDSTDVKPLIDAGLIMQAEDSEFKGTWTITGEGDEAITVGYFEG